MNSSIKNSITVFFDNRASDYSVRSVKGLWGIIRRSEDRAFTNVVQKINFDSAVDLCCGDGYYTRHLQVKTPKYLAAVDLSQTMIDALKGRGVETYCDDVTTFKPNFNPGLVICCGGMEFIRDIKQLFLHIATYTKSDATLIILTPRRNLFGILYYLWLKMFNVRAYIHSYSEIRAAALSNEWKMESTENAGLMSALYHFKRI